MPCKEGDYNSTSDEHISSCTNSGAQTQPDTSESGAAAHAFGAKGHRLRDRALALGGFILAPFMAVGMLAGVVSMSQFMPQHYRLSCILTAAAAVAAIYIIIRLLKALFACL